MPADSATTFTVRIPDHTLLRVIGRGSYGEVWLARNVMGTLRAVKIVRRAAFDSDRPYLREFDGTRRCEPVSRAHDGLIDILHMGRSDEEGWFYYVMELADGTDGKDGRSEDDASGERPAPHDSHPSHSSHTFDPSRYTPATLATRLTDGRPLPVTDCLRLAESLAGALAFLHEHGLIHRDVKPSNVLYIGGVPKLGDIGLVAEAGSSRSFVGTEGFVPLEGPGTERADIFALGKVLYEALTGLDREKFPRLPPRWTEDAEFEQRVELNEIVLRACEGDPVRRYQTAREMLADVALVASGRSIKKLRGMERRLRQLRWAGLGAAAVAVLALGGSWVVRQQAERERALRVRAELTEHAALLDQVHAARHDPTPGAVTRALRTAAEAAAGGVTPQLRDDAIFLLSRPDFVLRADMAIPWSVENGLRALDADSGLAAETPNQPLENPGPLSITVHIAGAPDKCRTLTVEKPPRWLQRLEFSRGGERLLLAGWWGGGAVLDTASGAVLAAFVTMSKTATPLRFCGDKGDQLIRRSAEGGLALFGIPGGARTTTPPLTDWPVRDPQVQPQSLWPSPDGTRVLLIDTQLQWPPLASLVSLLLPQDVARPVTGTACLVEVASGRMLWKWSGADEQVAAWSPDGTRVALRSGERIHILDAATGTIAAVVPHPLYSRGTVLCFLHDRDHLVFHTWSENGLCELTSGRLLCHPPVAGSENYSATRRLLLCENGAAEWRPSPVLRTFHPQPLRDDRLTVSLPPDDSCLIAANSESFTLWQLNEAGSTPAKAWPVPGAIRAIFPPGAGAEFHARDGVRIVPWTPGDWNTALPSLLPDPRAPNSPGGHRSYWFSFSSDGRVRATGGLKLVGTFSEDHDPVQTRFPVTDSTNPVALSPDGHCLAVGGYRVTGVRIWPSNAPTKLLHEEPSGTVSAPSFSPDGKWLAIASVHDHRFLEAGTWRCTHLIPRPPLYLLNPVSFTPDSRLCAVQSTMPACALVEPGTWRTRCHFHSPAGKLLSNCALSPGGRYFTATGIRQEVFVWDLRAVEQELAALGINTGTP